MLQMFLDTKPPNSETCRLTHVELLVVQVNKDSSAYSAPTVPAQRSCR